MSVLFSGNGHPLLCHLCNFCLYFTYYGNFVPSLAVDTWISSEFDWRHKQCLLLEIFFSLPMSWENVLNQQYPQVCYVTMTLLGTSGTKIMKKLKHLSGIWWCEELWDVVSWLNANQLSAGPGSTTWKWKNSELVIVVSQGVSLEWGSLVSVEENPLNTLLKLPLLRVLLYQSFLQDLLPAKAFKAALQKRCNGSADSSRS